MRPAILLLVPMLAALAAGCGALRDVEPFQPLATLRTGADPSHAEGGHGEPFRPPAGLRIDGELAGITAERDELARSHYELTLAISDTSPGPTDPRGEPVPGSAELVDDSGNRFPATRMQQPAGAGDRDPQAPRRYWLVFDLPHGYRFREIMTVAVHWRLRIGDDEIPLTMRFTRG